MSAYIILVYFHYSCVFALCIKLKESKAFHMPYPSQQMHSPVRIWTERQPLAFFPLLK